MSIIVKKKPGESDDNLINRFKKEVFFSKIIDEIKEKQFYKSPAELKKEKLAAIRKGRR